MKNFFCIFFAILGLGIFYSARAASLPVPTEPCQDQAVSNLSPELKWSPSDNTRSYGWEVYLLKDGQRDKNLGGGGTGNGETSAVVRPNMLQSNNKYEWRVQPVYNNGNIGGWSSWCRFNTYPPANVSAFPPEAPPAIAPAPIISGGPTISGLSPNKGPVGTTVKVTGEKYACSTYEIPKNLNSIIFTGDNGKVYTDSSPGCEELYTLKTVIPPFSSEVKTIALTVQVSNKKSGSANFNITALVPSSATNPSSGGGGSKSGIKIPPPACEGKKKTIEEPRFYQVSGNRLAAYDGLVPCGKCVILTNLTPSEDEKKLIERPANSPELKYVSCQFCHFQIMFAAIINFLLFMVIVPVAVLFIVIGGLMFVFSAGNQSRISKARSMIIGVSVALAIVFGAWMIINIFFSLIGLSDFSLGLTGPGNWFKVICDKTPITI